jgi:hypothetical protein
MSRRAAGLFVATLMAQALASCGERRPPEATNAIQPVTGPLVRYSFQAVDGRPISTRSMANRVTVIGFLATYDVPSQVEARFLAMLERRHSPKINVAALVLEAPENQPLVEAFVTSLRLEYPIAMADAATIAGEGPFAGLHHVPSVVVLDRAGREAWRHAGLVNEAVLEAAVRAVEAASPPAAPERADDDAGATGG